MGYVVSRIHQLKAELAAMPEVDPAIREVSKLEAVRQLAPDIALLQKKGYRLDQVVGFLTERGFAMTVGTLKTYLSRLKPRRLPQRTGDTRSTASKPSRGSRRPAVGSEDSGAVNASATAVSAGAEPASISAKYTPDAAVGSQGSGAVSGGDRPVNAASGPLGPGADTAAEQPVARGQHPVTAAAAVRAPLPAARTPTSKAGFAMREDSDDI